MRDQELQSDAFKVPDDRFAPGQIHRDDVDAVRARRPASRVPPTLGAGRECSQLGSRDSFFRSSKRAILPGFHFHEYELIAIEGDKIDLPHPRHARLALKDAKTSRAQKRGREVFPFIADYFPFGSHFSMRAFSANAADCFGTTAMR